MFLNALILMLFSNPSSTVASTQNPSDHRPIVFGGMVVVTTGFYSGCVGVAQTYYEESHEYLVVGKCRSLHFTHIIKEADLTSIKSAQ